MSVENADRTADRTEILSANKARCSYWPSHYTHPNGEPCGAQYRNRMPTPPSSHHLLQPPPRRPPEETQEDKA